VDDEDGQVAVAKAVGVLDSFAGSQGRVAVVGIARGRRELLSAPVAFEIDGQLREREVVAAVVGEGDVRRRGLDDEVRGRCVVAGRPGDDRGAHEQRERGDDDGQEDDTDDFGLGALPTRSCPFGAVQRPNRSVASSDATHRYDSSK
jgi:hypothetical protein